MDENYAAFLTWTIRRARQQELPLGEIERLATRCPQTDGNVVFTAQNLYNAVTNERRWFTTVCDGFTREDVESIDSTRRGERMMNTVSPQPAVTGNDDIIVYPNPAKSILTIKGSNLKQVELINAYGASILVKRATFNVTTISLGNLSSGIYFLKVTDLNNRVSVKRVFKNLY